MRSPQGLAPIPTDIGSTRARRNRLATQRVGWVAGAAITAIVASTLGATAPAFAATPPVFPDNIVIFPDRDFVVADYPSREGQTAVITVTRGALITGRAEGQVSGGLLEVNHPGGVCWGTGAGAPNITPNIMAGDTVTVAFGTASDSAVTQSPTVTGFSQPTANTVVVDGTLGAPGGPAANTAQLEQRIVAPDLTTTTVGRRDIRAGETTPGSFTSSITFPTATTFLATYTFNDPAVADVAAAGQARALTWQGEDADANRQGMTIAEFGEIGGPGFGGCPLGTPTPAVAPTTPVIGAAKAGNAAALVTWREQASGGSPITGYSVRVFNSANVQVGALRSALAGDTSLRVTGLTNGQSYRFQVSARNAVGSSAFSTPSKIVVPASAPGRPRIGSASSGVAGGAVNAVARWAGPASNGGAAINGYVVTAIRINANGTEGVAKSWSVNSGSARSLTFGATAGNYRFVVRARNVMGLGANSPRSNLVTAR